jgi:hypothetical protein
MMAEKQHPFFFPSPAYRKTNLPFLDEPELTVNSLIRISALSS